MSDIVHNVVLEDEFRTCPICRYDDGFHTILRRNAESDEVRWLFVCPSCHEVFDIGQTSS